MIRMFEFQCWLGPASRWDDPGFQVVWLHQMFVPLVNRPVAYEELPEQGRKQVPPALMREGKAPKFWVCGNCQQVYWRGSQFERCLDHLCARLSVGPTLATA